MFEIYYLVDKAIWYLEYFNCLIKLLLSNMENIIYHNKYLFYELDFLDALMLIYF